RREPGESSVVSDTPEGEPPITVEPVPPEKSRLRGDAGHRLDGGPHDLEDTPDWNHGAWSHGVTDRFMNDSWIHADSASRLGRAAPRCQQASNCGSFSSPPCRH